MAIRHSTLRVFAVLLVFLSLTLSAGAAPRETQDPDSISARIIRFLKKIPRPTLPHVFDEPIPPRP